MGQENMKKIFATFRTCVHPSFTTSTFAYVVGARAMAIPESVREGKNGFLFAPGDEGECAEKITRVLTMPEKQRRKMSENARATAEKYSVPKSTSRLLEVYEELL